MFKISQVDYAPQLSSACDSIYILRFYHKIKLELESTSDTLSILNEQRSLFTYQFYTYVVVEAMTEPNDELDVINVPYSKIFVMISY